MNRDRIGDVEMKTFGLMKTLANAIDKNYKYFSFINDSFFGWKVGDW